jgi:hypothetical protein
MTDVSAAEESAARGGRAERGHARSPYRAGQIQALCACGTGAVVRCHHCGRAFCEEHGPAAGAASLCPTCHGQLRQRIALLRPIGAFRFYLATVASCASLLLLLSWLPPSGAGPRTMMLVLLGATPVGLVATYLIVHRLLVRWLHTRPSAAARQPLVWGDEAATQPAPTTAPAASRAEDATTPTPAAEARRLAQVGRVLGFLSYLPTLFFVLLAFSPGLYFGWCGTPLMGLMSMAMMWGILVAVAALVFRVLGQSAAAARLLFSALLSNGIIYFTLTLASILRHQL